MRMALHTGEADLRTWAITTVRPSTTARDCGRWRTERKCSFRQSRLTWCARAWRQKSACGTWASTSSKTWCGPSTCGSWYTRASRASSRSGLAPRVRHNLPAQATPFIGRHEAIEAITARLGSDGVRVVTMTGAGGIGKTRLALQVATELVDKFADGVFFVPLARIADPSLVVATIAQTLGIREVGAAFRS